MDEVKKIGLDKLRRWRTYCEMEPRGQRRADIWLSVIRGDLQAPYTDKAETYDKLNVMQTIRDSISFVSEGLKAARAKFYGK